MPQSARTPGPWTGEIYVQLRNARDWACGLADFSVGFDTCQVRFSGRTVGVLDRDGLREWLSRPAGLSFEVDDLILTFAADKLWISIQGAVFSVVSESTDLLRRAI
jgi:hypothetical protein